MDDLSGLNWSSSASAKPAVPQATTSATASAAASFPVLRPTPPPPLASSGRNTPLSTLGPGLGTGSGIINNTKKPAAKPAASHDSFSSLANFGRGGASTSSANLTLREQQERLEAERRRKEEEKRQQARANYGEGQFWDALAGQGQRQGAAIAGSVSGTVSPAIRLGSGAATSGDDEDLFAAFNTNTKVDNASYYPPPPASPEKASPAARGLDLTNPSAWAGVSGSKAVDDGGAFGDNNDPDDPFGFNQLGNRSGVSAQSDVARGDEEDDDLLGDLGKPVDQLRKRQSRPEPEPPKFAREPIPGKPIEDSSSDSDGGQAPARPDNPFDRAVAQLVDYGFTAENAQRALTESGSGLDVQAAVNWLLDEAHRKSKEQTKQRGAAPGEPRARERDRSSGPPSRNGKPARVQGDMAEADRRRRDNMSPPNHPGDGEFAKTAAAMGIQFLKTAGTLWKTGQKKMQQAVAEFQQEGGDPNQPKWMRSSQPDRSDEGPGERRRKVADDDTAAAAAAGVTDEAMMLDGGVRPGGRPKLEHGSLSNSSSRDISPAQSEASQGRHQPTAPKWQQASQPILRDPRSRLNKLAAEEKGARYVSPARRRKAATPQPEARVKAQQSEPEPDLLFDPSAFAAARSKAAPPFTQPQQQPTPKQPPRAARSPRPAPSRPPRPRRDIPAVSAIALQSSTKHRLEGTAHFKRGDYATAHGLYTSSLSAIPQTHPLAILLLCNRALTSLKTGEPRQAIVDADAAIGLIGPAGGEGERVELVTGSHNNANANANAKANGAVDSDAREIDMRELYGKALSRKAEALEQMEKWGEAGTVWQRCVEAGLGGATAAAGRQRCQAALAPKPPPRPRPAATPRARPAAPAAATAQSSQAVARLRAANQAAEREGQEKFEASDKVDARVAAWRDGKRENLRALLGSLDKVLWDGSGWKVGMHELVMANKVKIVYMRAIAKTHPDKIAQDASTEVRMIAGFVFSTLNEAWDKFKAENGL